MRTGRIGRTAAIGTMLSGLSAACAPIRIFNAVMPQDGGVSAVARNVAFGGDPRQRLDVYAPRRPGSTAAPVVIFLYGGSWNSGTKAGYGFVGRALASRGFVVVIPDYRLVPAVRYPVFLNDNAAAVHWTRSHVAALGGDPDRLVLAGHSAGAYNAAMLAIDPRWLGDDRKAVRGWIGLAGPYDFLPLDEDVTRETFGSAPDLPGTQPGAHVATGDPPALLVTGDDDTLVRPSNSDTLAGQLMAAGVPVERIRYAGIGHAGLVTAIARPFRRRAPVLADMAAFATRVTMPAIRARGR
jgi:acetyl esterase/lipase